ncbi:MAG: MFS transporter [Deltaproteobacteria bacterium]|nr:MFS transporter [Deltaproteobacteria bacterium]
MSAIEPERRRGRAVIGLLVVAYASIYLCRANVEPVFNILAARHGYDNERIGLVFALALGAYALGKVVLGTVGDVVGGKKILVASMTSSVVAMILLALVDWPSVLGPQAALWVIGAFVVANRFGQSGGWGGVVHVAAQWFPATRRGAVMGVVSTSFDVGNVVALLSCAGLVAAGAGWRTLCVVPAALLAIAAVVVAVGLPAGSPPPSAREAAQSEEEERESVRAILARLLRSRELWLAVVQSFLLTFARAGFMTWTPKFLYDVSLAAGRTSALSGSIAKSAFFGAAGMTGSLVVGRLSDRWGPGRRAGVMGASLAVLLAAVLVIAHGGARDPLVVATLIGVAGFFLLGPYSLLGGAITLDVAGKRGASTAVGIIDGVGYLGASLSAAVLGSVSKRAGWSRAFDVLAAVIALAIVVALVWWRRAGGAAAEKRLEA